MSVRAYRQLCEPKLADAATFNLWHDSTVLEQLETLESTYVSSTECDIAQIEVYIAEVEELLQSEPFEPDITEAFQKDIAAAKKDDQEYILYHCY